MGFFWSMVKYVKKEKNWEWFWWTDGNVDWWTTIAGGYLNSCLFRLKDSDCCWGSVCCCCCCCCCCRRCIRFALIFFSARIVVVSRVFPWRGRTTGATAADIRRSAHGEQDDGRDQDAGDAGAADGTANSVRRLVRLLLWQRCRSDGCPQAIEQAGEARDAERDPTLAGPAPPSAPGHSGRLGPPAAPAQRPPGRHCQLGTPLLDRRVSVVDGGGLWWPQAQAGSHRARVQRHWWRCSLHGPGWHHYELCQPW